MLPVTMARSSSDSVVIHYVVLCLWLTLCFHSMRPMDQNQLNYIETRGPSIG